MCFCCWPSKKLSMRNLWSLLPLESLLVVSIGAGILPHHPIGGSDLYFSYDYIWHMPSCQNPHADCSIWWVLRNGTSLWIMLDPSKQIHDGWVPTTIKSQKSFKAMPIWMTGNT